MVSTQYVLTLAKMVIVSKGTESVWATVGTLSKRHSCYEVLSPLPPPCPGASAGSATVLGNIFIPPRRLKAAGCHRADKCAHLLPLKLARPRGALMIYLPVTVLLWGGSALVC